MRPSHGHQFEHGAITYSQCLPQAECLKSNTGHQQSQGFRGDCITMPEQFDKDHLLRIMDAVPCGLYDYYLDAQGVSHFPYFNQ